MDQNWTLWAHKIRGPYCAENCDKHYEGTWQPRRSGSLEDCMDTFYEEAGARTSFDAFRLEWKKNA